MTDPIHDLWSAQYQGAGAMSPTALADAERRFRQEVWRRDRREYVAGALAAIFFAAIGLFAPDWGVRAGAALIVAGTGLVMINLRRRRPVAPDPAKGLPSRAFVRAQLVAQRETLMQVWRWYVLPVVPGLCVFVLATAWPRLAPKLLPHAIAEGVLALLPFGMILAIILWLNASAARRLQQRIDVLDRENG